MFADRLWNRRSSAGINCGFHSSSDRSHTCVETPHCALPRNGLAVRRALIQNQPIKTKLPDSLDKIPEFYGFPDVAVRAKPISFHAVLLLVRRRENHHRQEPRSRVRAQRSQNLKARNLRQLQIQQNHMRHDSRVAACVSACAEKEIERLHSVASDHHMILDIILLQRTQSQRFVVRIVLDQQNRPLVHCFLRFCHSP